MTTDTSIFGLRFRSNHELLPAPAELAAFLASPKNAGGRELHGDDLAPFSKLLKNIEAFGRGDAQGAGEQAFLKKMFFGALSHSHFAKPALKSAVEEYLYHLHALALLELNKPLAFIKSAEAELARLNPKKKDEAARLARMRTMVEQRKAAVDALTLRWAALAEELGHIAQYIRDNLVKIEKLCEASIVILVSEQIDRIKELGMIEDIKEHFKERLREALHRGTITAEQLKTAKEDVAELSKRTADHLRTDVFLLTGLYEGVHDHVKNIMGELDGLLSQVSAKRVSLDADKELFAAVERVLVRLVRDFRFELKAVKLTAETKHETMLFEKRKEMLDHLFDLLQR